MNVFGLMVTKNEEHRYLQSSLKHNAALVNGMLVFDDWSDDRTLEIASTYATVSSRSRECPPFSEHEGAFRRASWDALVEIFAPCDGDVIVAVDADEYLIGDISDFHGAAARVAIDEGWGMLADGRTPLIRVDRAWGMIHNVRVWKWSDLLLDDCDVVPWGGKPMASGCGPLQGTQTLHHSLRILHAGYLHPDDHQVKYDRYVGIPGHGTAHVESILEAPTLVPFDGQPPLIWRGII